VVNRGSVVVAAIGGSIGNKPRPGLIFQNDYWLGTKTLLVIPFTSDLDIETVVRPIFEPSSTNGLRERSALMTDKMTPVRRTDIGEVVGRLTDDDMAQAEEAIQIVLGMM
jgi:mRNA interferase MazF